MREIASDSRDGCEQEVPGGEGARFHPIGGIVWIVTHDKVWHMRPCDKPREVTYEWVRPGRVDRIEFEAIEASMALGEDALLLFAKVTDVRYGRPAPQLYVAKGGRLRAVFLRDSEGDSDSIMVEPTGLSKSTDGKAIWVGVERSVCRLMVRDLLRERDDKGEVFYPECSGHMFGSLVTSLSAASSTGPIWVGTKEGVFYWPEVYADNPENLSRNAPQRFAIGATVAIARDSSREDRAWALTRVGRLYLLDGHAGRSEQIRRFPPARYQSIDRWERSLLLFGGDRVDECLECDVRKQIQTFTRGPFHEAYPAGDGSLWLAGHQSTRCTRAPPAGASSSAFGLLAFFLLLGADLALGQWRSRGSPTPGDRPEAMSEPRPPCDRHATWTELRLTKNDKHQVIEAMLKLRSMRGLDDRKRVVESVGTPIQERILESPQPRTHVEHIVNTCSDFRGGMLKLRNALCVVEEDTIHMRELDALLESIAGSSKGPAGGDEA